MSAASWAVVVVTLSLVLVAVIACRSWASSVAPEPMPRPAPLALPAGGGWVAGAPTTGKAPASTVPALAYLPVMGVPGATVPADLVEVLAPKDLVWLAELLREAGGRR